MIITSMGAVHSAICQQISDPTTALVAFDVDMTLSVPRHPAGHHPHMQENQEVLKALLEPLTTEEKDRAITLATQASGQQLAETDTPTLIQDIQQQGIKTIALTASLTGELVDLGDLKQLRFRDLQALGMDFRPAFDVQEMLLTEIPTFNGNHPLYHQGILHANGGRGPSNKGAVLVAFLKRVGWKPQQVIMIDDLPVNLTDIAHALAQFDPDIQFLGIDYHGAKAYAPMPITEEAFVGYWQDKVDRIG